jgi:putative ABC transport system permease protein
MVLVSGLLAGLYPALVISRPKPIELLRNSRNGSFAPGIFRKLLVAVQLSIATILIISVLFIFKQISFMKNHELGFNKKGLVALDLSLLEGGVDVWRRKAVILEQEVSKQAIQNGIESIGAMESIPGMGCKNGFTVYNTDNLEAYTVNSIGIDENFSEVLELPLIEGQNFSKDQAADQNAILINETLKRKLGWSSIENKQLALFSKDYKVNVIGVFKDMNISSLAQNIPPMIYRYKENAYPQYMAFRAKAGQEDKAISLIKSEWGKISDDKPFSTFSVADRFNFMYRDEECLSKIIGAFCLIAVMLSCFGLLAYVALYISQRTKEIGIRKVNGASVSEVISMLNKDFVKWVFIAFIIATPIAYYVMHKWLENFAYKAELSWWIFAISGVLALGIALLTVSWQSWKAAIRNPVEALRYE